MTTSVIQTKCLALAVIAVTFAVGPAFADKPSWAGKQSRQDQRWPDRRDYSERGRHDRDHDRRDRDPRDHGPVDRRDQGHYEETNPPGYRGGRYFADQHRSSVYTYYHDTYRSGRCPPGLAKKHNGCVPPGHARPWAIGRPLPRHVIFYDVPPPVVMGLGYPPPGYRFVRVASDILMIAIGTGLVMDAIYDLGGGW